MWLALRNPRYSLSNAYLKYALKWPSFAVRLPMSTCWSHRTWCQYRIYSHLSVKAAQHECQLTDLPAHLMRALTDATYQRFPRQSCVSNTYHVFICSTISIFFISICSFIVKKLFSLVIHWQYGKYRFIFESWQATHIWLQAQTATQTIETNHEDMIVSDSWLQRVPLF